MHARHRWQAVIAAWVLFMVVVPASGCGYIAAGVIVLAASGGSSGGGGGGTVNQPPAVTDVSVPAGILNDLIRIDYKLRDAERDFVDIGVFYSTDGVNFDPATLAVAAGSGGTFGLRTAPEGVAYQVIWNSREDLGGGNVSGVVIEITCFDFVNGEDGVPEVSAPFDVFNRYVATIAGGVVGSGLNFPNGMAIDPGAVAGPVDDVIYVADSFNNRVMAHDLGAGEVRVVAGTGEPGFNGDDLLATDAKLSLPQDVALTPGGDLLICDSGNDRVRQVNATTGFITTAVGGGLVAPPLVGDGGVSTGAVLRFPSGIDLDAAGNIYIADRGHHRVRFVNRQPMDLVLLSRTIPPSFIETIAGDGTGPPGGPTGDGNLADQAAVRFPGDVAVDDNLWLYITQPEDHRVRVVNLDTGPRMVAGIPVAAETIETLAGDGSPGYAGDGGAPQASRVRVPDGVATDSAGNVYVSDAFNGRLRLVNTTGSPVLIAGTPVLADTIDTIVGTGVTGSGGDGGPASMAPLGLPTGVLLDDADNILVSEGASNGVRVVNTQATPQTWGTVQVAPDAIDTIPFSLEVTGDQVGLPIRVVADPFGFVYFTDISEQNLSVSEGHRVFRFDPIDGELIVFAGTGRAGFSGDGGPASTATFSLPTDLAIDPFGHLLVADAGNSRIRAINTDFLGPVTIAGVTIDPGEVATVVGDGGVGWTGDGGAALSAEIGFPVALDMDPGGNIHFVDNRNHVVRFVNVQGVDWDIAGLTVRPDEIATIGGDGTPGYSGDGGFSTAARFDSPLSIAVDQDGSVVVADAGNFRIRAINTQSYDRFIYGLDIPAGFVDTIAGDGTPGDSGDGGDALFARFGEVSDVSIDISGNLWIADSTNHRVRVFNTNPGADLDLGSVYVLPLFIETAVGTGRPGYNGDGLAPIDTNLTAPRGVALFQDRAPIVCDTENRSIRIANLDFFDIQLETLTIAFLSVRTIAGDAESLGNRLVVAPVDLLFDGAGNILFSDSQTGNNESHRVFQIDPASRSMAILGGNGNASYDGDGQPFQRANFWEPTGLALDPSGNLYIADSRNHIVRAVNRTGSSTMLAGVGPVPPGVIVTIAGVPETPGYDGNLGMTATASRLDTPRGVEVAPGGDILISDGQNHQIRRVDSSNQIWLLAGNDPVASGSGPGEFFFPGGLHRDGPRLLVADTGNHRVQEVDIATGISTVLVGSPLGLGGFNGDGLPPTTILLQDPAAVATDAAGNVFISDTDNHRLLVYNRGVTDLQVAETLVEPGLVRRVAGTGTPGFNGDSLPPTSTQLSGPTGILLDPGGDVYISDTGNRRIRRFSR